MPNKKMIFRLEAREELKWALAVLKYKLRGRKSLYSIGLKLGSALYKQLKTVQFYKMCCLYYKTTVYGFNKIVNVKSIYTHTHYLKGLVHFQIKISL